MADRQFYLWFPSNSSSEVFPRNTLSEYRVRLPNSIQLTGEWEVALTEIQYKKNWHNIRNFYNVIYVQAPSIERTSNPPGHYHTPQEVILNINEALKREGFEKDIVFPMMNSCEK